uniref:Uncharacterized protein n=1 Tax=Oryza meridionalis TaxID=40149 RepID=A0A0E0FED6_9ORYZ
MAGVGRGHSSSKHLRPQAKGRQARQGFQVANKVLLLEAVPPNLTDHCIEARVEVPYLALVHLNHHPKGSEVGRYGGLAAAQSCTWRAIGCAVDALTVGVATSHIVAHVPLVAANEPQGVAADDREVIARRGGEEGSCSQVIPSVFGGLGERGICREADVADGAEHPHLTTLQ